MKQADSATCSTSFTTENVNLNESVRASGPPVTQSCSTLFSPKRYGKLSQQLCIMALPDAMMVSVGILQQEFAQKV
jgi:hypothetical protein